MTEPEEKPMDLGLYVRSDGQGGMTSTEYVAAALSVIWVIAVVAYVWSAPQSEGMVGLVLTLLVVFLPLALIWAAVTTLRSVRALRAEAARLHSTVEAMRNAYIASQQAAAARPPERRLEEIAPAARRSEAPVGTFATRRDAGLAQPAADRKASVVQPRPDPEAEQPGLALGTPAEDLQAPLSVADFILSIQFPESPDDKVGFRALRAALDDRVVAKLIRASQDVLTLLSQEGIFMDDLKPDRIRPELWRKFAGGERGRAIAALGGVRDRSSLALTAGRMREDPIFRDAAHHFLRTFDRTFAAFEPQCSDADLADLSETRTARAFMLLGRVTGTFD